MVQAEGVSTGGHGDDENRATGVLLATPTLIYCAAGNPAFGRAALEAGWQYGARLPAWFDSALPLSFADQDWKGPDRAAYMACLEKHRPDTATVLDLEREEQLAEVLSWAVEAAAFVWRVLVIPKVSGVIERLPRQVGKAQVVLGYSVPTSYGGTTVPLWEFAGWPVHLLGGSPQRQLDLARFLDVVSLDGGMAQQQANRCRFWTRQKVNGSPWVQLRDAGDTRTEGANLECFRRSLVNIRAAWLRRVGSTLPPLPPAAPAS